ncbi:MAG TPA: hypothetical protein VGG45_18260 [Terracidiphilus sp.]|jgi:hypothetical protein
MSTKIAGWLTERKIGGCLLLILAAPTAKAAAMPLQDAAPTQQEQSAPQSGAQRAGTESGNEKPTADSAPSDQNLPDAPEVAQSAGTGSNGSNGSSQPSQDQQPNGAAQPQQQNGAAQPQQQNGAQQPVGTAAAPEMKGTGVSGSRVSGAAIAPAKQRRVHIFVISVAVVVAACVAVGTVAALSHATPSQPR